MKPSFSAAYDHPWVLTFETAPGKPFGASVRVNLCGSFSIGGFRAPKPPIGFSVAGTDFPIPATGGTESWQIALF